MKICQFKKFILFIIILFLILIPLVYVKAAIGDLAQSTTLFGSNKTCQVMSTEDIIAGGIQSETSGSLKIEVIDSATLGAGMKEVCITEMNGVDRTLDQIKTWAIDKALEELKSSTAIAYKAMLKNFLNTLAYDTATYLATGDKGQQPMFITESWGEYLKNTADNAAGTFLETLGKQNGIVKFNLCTPNPSVMLKINLGLQRTYKPKAPACTFSKLVDNWDTALKDKDFLPKFQDMFNPWSNDLGIALTLQTGMTQSINVDVDNAAKERLQNEGYKNLTDPITGNIKTPAVLIKEYGTDTLRSSKQAYSTYTGNAVADAIDVFVNTLIGKLVDQWMKKGLVTNFPNRVTSNLTDPSAQNESGGISEAEERFKKLVEASFKVRGDYDILNELTMCPDPSKAGPTNCVIDQKFREAIEKKLTVKQAIEQGYLNRNGIFGFTSDGLEPSYKEGYPYRSMIILRKFRILPVGWEVAAQKIKDQQGLVNGTKNLQDLVDCFSSAGTWCYGLVDPGWVLKAPQNYCKKEGAGAQILSEEFSGEGAGSSLNVLRNDAYCADEQSCVKERSDGACQLYGYCTEEKRTWDFNSKSCEPRENTCQTFKLGENSFSYLQNTLDYSLCNISNAGCKKYATSGSYDSSSKSVNWDQTNQIYFNKNAETCQAEDQGCHAFIRLTPDKGETYADIRNAGVNAAYNRFASTGLIYEKLLPDYLKGACYSYGSGGILDGTLKNDAPAACSKFVRNCKAEEAGCELYTSAADDSEVPAKVSPEDYCPAECVSYDTYVQKETAFDLSRDAYFIPKTAKKCSAEAVGCSQFTNLDEVSRGGEGIEYYTYLRQCLKKTGNESSCGEFYSWEGSDESGYQLKVESLKASGAEPFVTEDDASLCNEAIYNLSPSNPAYNVDCRQFYNRQGGLSYHLYRNTVSCSDDCHPYRKTLAVDDTALACKGGVWDSTEKSCVYMAIPGQGAKCSAGQNGCREYTGNMGNDIRNIFTDDFSGGTTANWTGVNGTTVAPSNEAINLDSNNKGNSLYISGGQFSASRLAGNSVITGKSYVLSFVAKASTPTFLNLSLTNSSGAKANFAPVSLTIDWQIFQTNLADLDHAITADEILLLAAGQNFYIDNITLTEIVDRYYLIKDSWRTPASCDSDQSGAPYALYMLGCGKYADRNNKTHYLKSFTELCSESAVGCELMIDTKNSTATSTETFVNSGTTKTVLADSFTYVVYDKDKLCSSQDKGCSLLGQAYEYEDTILYGDTYIKDNPDKYNTILCGIDAVGCEAFTYNEGEKYFKDPGDQVCEWRKATESGQTYNWYKKKVKRCGGNTGEVCLSDKDCTSGVTCQLETADNPCAFSDTKTLGLGGKGGLVNQPIPDDYGNWVGICSADNSGCTEYIDPISKFSTNIIFNGNFQTLANGPTDGWNGNSQNVVLEPNTVYRIGGPLVLEQCSLAAGGALYKIDANNNLSSAGGQIYGPAIFYYKGSTAVSCSARYTAITPVELKRAIINYQLNQNIDTATCNGIVNVDKGCVLFNKRSQEGRNINKLVFNANATGSGTTPSTSGNLDSNIIVKVTPDRTCDKWLACKSYVKDTDGSNVCFGIGLCDAVNENGDCSNFIQSKQQNQIVENLSADKISNLSGYSKVGVNGTNLTLINDYYPLGAMTQVGDLVNLANGGFEYYTSSLYPIGWNWAGQPVDRTWDSSIFSVVNNPVSAQVEGIGRAKEGQSFLKLGSTYDATSEDLDVMPNTDYIVTAYVNTKNLKNGTTTIDVVGAASGGKIQQAVGKDWQFKVATFRTGSNYSINLKLYASGSKPEGNFYFDDIKIRPALKSKENFHTIQSCRLYPKSDSLSCDYYEDSGVRQKGWYGYCLEYDRPPGDPNTCLLWYPVDKVKGDGIEEGAGYQGKIPAYYCLEAKALVPLEYRWTSGIFDSTGEGDNTNNGSCSTGYQRVKLSTGNPGCGYSQCAPSDSDTCIDDCKLDASVFKHKVKSGMPKYTSGWYLYNGFDNNPLTDGQKSCLGGTHDWPATNESTKGIKYYDPSTGKVYDDTFAYCTKVAQTVTSTGDNKYWSSRVYKGSDWYVSGLNYRYANDDPPFGSIVAPSSNVLDWDGSSVDGKQPLIVQGKSSGQVRASSPYNLASFPVAGSYYGFCSGSSKLCLRIVASGGIIPYEKNKADCGPNDGDCVQGNFTGDPINGKLNYLFAKSYGGWIWRPQVCSNKNGQLSPGGQSEGYACLGTNQCQFACSQYRCVNSSNMTDSGVTNTVCDASEDAPCADLNNGTCNTFYHCVNGAKAGSACSPNSPNSDCLGCPGYTYGTCSSGKCVGGNVAAGTTCTSPVQCNTCSTTATTATCVKYKQCAGGCNAGTTCTDDTICEANQNCYQCVPSVCADGLNASKRGTKCLSGGSAVCSGFCPPSSYIVDPNYANTAGYTPGNVAWKWVPPRQYATAEGPAQVCPGTTRPNNLYCGIAPRVFNLKVNNSSSVNIVKNGFVNFTFNSKVDSNQLPLVMYQIDWGDGETTTVTGVEMAHRPNPTEPHSMYHLYSYWDLKAKAAQGQPISCGTNSCNVTPRVIIRDNWGWFSSWTSGVSVTVSEK